MNRELMVQHITCAGTAQAYNDFLDFVAEG